VKRALSGFFIGRVRSPRANAVFSCEAVPPSIVRQHAGILIDFIGNRGVHAQAVLKLTDVAVSVSNGAFGFVELTAKGTQDLDFYPSQCGHFSTPSVAVTWAFELELQQSLYHFYGRAYMMRATVLRVERNPDESATIEIQFEVGKIKHELTLLEAPSHIEALEGTPLHISGSEVHIRGAAWAVREGRFLKLV